MDPRLLLVLAARSGRPPIHSRNLIPLLRPAGVRAVWRCGWRNADAGPCVETQCGRDTSHQASATRTTLLFPSTQRTRLYYSTTLSIYPSLSLSLASISFLNNNTS
jgi:hypothetical protein